MSSKMMKMAMLNSQRNNKNDEEYHRNQIGFQYPVHTDYNRNYDRSYDRNDYDRRMEAEPIYSRRRDDSGRYMVHEPYDDVSMHHDKDYEKQSDNTIPMQGYLGIAYSVDNYNKLSKKQAENWTKSMKNENGSKGARWSFEEVQNVMRQQNVNCDPIEFYVVMNMLYSDYGAVFKKHDVATIQFYVDMAKAFLEDEDAVKNKLEQYYRYVVKH